MKCDVTDSNVSFLESLPVRGAWIEICCNATILAAYRQSLPVRGAWIEIECVVVNAGPQLESLPVRGAWIEMVSKNRSVRPPKVAPRKGSVD